MCEVIAIASQKGGVAKTTTTEHLGIGLASEGQNVLLIDTDPQGSLTNALGYNPDELEITLATIFEKIINDEPIKQGFGILHNLEGVDLVPANLNMSGIEMSLMGIMSREYILREYIEIIRNNYDYILIDCMPSLGLLPINAFSCADSVLIPVEPAHLSVAGLQQLIRSIGRIRKRLNPNISIKGILFTKVENGTTNDKILSSLVKETYGNNIKIYNTTIPKNVKLKETSSQGISVYQYAPKSKGAIAFMTFTKEVLDENRI